MAVNALEIPGNRYICIGGIKVKEMYFAYKGRFWYEYVHGPLLFGPSPPQVVPVGEKVSVEDHVFTVMEVKIEGPSTTLRIAPPLGVYTRDVHADCFGR